MVAWQLKVVETVLFLSTSDPQGKIEIDKEESNNKKKGSTGRLSTFSYEGTLSYDG